MELVENSLMENTIKDRIVGDNPNLTSRMVSHIILHAPFRQYFIDHVKAPLLENIVSLAGKYPEPTKDNLEHPVALAMLDIMEKFYTYEDNKIRIGLFKAMGKLATNEIEHDGYYRERLQFILEEIIKAILSGKWTPRDSGNPAICWKEPQPHGGAHSIIAKMIEHKEEILAILEGNND